MDAAFDKIRRICAIAVIFRDHRGNLITGSSEILPADSPVAAEALAMREAFKSNHELQYG